MTQPTKLPDDLFSPDDRQWQDADYPARVALLLARYRTVVQGDAVLAADDARHTREVIAAQRARIETLAADLRESRSINAQLVETTLTQEGEILVLRRERAAAVCDLEATGMKLAAALIEIGTYKLTTHPIEGAGK